MNAPSSRDPKPASPGAAVRTTENPPSTFWGALARIGPGLIIAGSIVGSGELIATTKTGAEAGMALLWLIIIGCVIKVFVQVEFGRYTIVNGRSTMDGLNEVPGPRLIVNWLIWYWLLMFAVMTAQLGGIAGGVGQSLALTVPISGDYLNNIRFAKDRDERVASLLAAASEKQPLNSDEKKLLLDAAIKQTEIDLTREGRVPPVPFTYDDVYWTALLAVVTSSLLVIGRYRMVETVSTLMVAGFTLVTVAGVIALQLEPATAFNWADIAYGLSFHLPEGKDRGASLATAMATFGIIGVGASEVIAYPYWCLEKGYARFTGPRDDSTLWGNRASGWMRVLHVDVWCSMIVYTTATLAFFFMGAGVLHRKGRSIENSQMIVVLADMYDACSLFLGYGDYVLLFGAFAVLYSTFFVASAGNARMAGDALKLFGLCDKSDAAMRRWVTILCGVLPILSFLIYFWTKSPVTLVMISGVTQGFMLPMLGAAALFFRYQRCDSRVRPGPIWDFFLWLSVLGLCLSGGYGLVAQFSKFLPSAN